MSAGRSWLKEFYVGFLLLVLTFLYLSHLNLDEVNANLENKARLENKALHEKKVRAEQTEPQVPLKFPYAKVLIAT